MSNKKRKIEKVSLRNRQSDEAEIKSVGDDSFGRGNRISYLKSHLWMVAVICFLALGALGAGLKYLDEDARRELAERANHKGVSGNRQESFLNKINPFLPAALPSSTPQLAKEYIYAGGRTLAVEDANASAAPPADLAVWRPSSGVWWVMGGQGSQQTSQGWGMSGDLPVAGDYDGDGKTDFAVYRPNNPATSEDECDGGCKWYVLSSASSTWIVSSFGITTDTPVAADYDGDGRTDVAVYRASAGAWYVLRSSDAGFYALTYGVSTDIPAAADYDGDGKADIGVWRPSETAFYSLNSSNNAQQIPTLGQSGDRVVSADYDGDGKADYAVYNSSSANWFVRQSTTNTVVGFQWGAAGDKPVQNDYDGDGKVDIAVWRDSNGNWYIRKSGSGGQLRQEQWGISGDIPVPAFYRR